MDDIKALIDSGDLEQRNDTIQCPACDNLAGFYSHVDDEEIVAQYCENCGTAEWVEKYGSKSNPKRCPYCEELVTEDQVKNDKSVKCSNRDIFDEQNCEKLAHAECAEHCVKCGWFCDPHTANQIQCDSCGVYHDVNHFISFGSDFVGSFGNICGNCFYDNEEEYIDEVDTEFARMGTPSEEELEAEKAYRKKHELKNAADLKKEDTQTILHALASLSSLAIKRKRSDSSIYLSHFVRQKDQMSNQDCLLQLLKILKDKKIEARPTGYYKNYTAVLALMNASKAVCLTEGRISALKEHANDYSNYGIAFSKFNLLKNHQTAPAVYIHDAVLKIIQKQMPIQLVPYVTMIKPDGHNFHHEREWRTPNDLVFEYGEIFAIFAPEDAHDAIRAIAGPTTRIICIESVLSL